MKNRTPVATTVLFIATLFSLVFALGSENLNSTIEIQEDLGSRNEQLQNDIEHRLTELSTLADDVQSLQEQENTVNKISRSRHYTVLVLENEVEISENELNEIKKIEANLTEAVEEVLEEYEEALEVIEVLEVKKAESEDAVKQLEAEYKREKERKAAREAAERERRAAASSQSNSSSSGSYSRQDIIRLIHEVFGPVHGPNAVTIAKCESNLNPRLTNWDDPHGGSHGIFQINGVHGYSRHQLYDPEFNVRAAKRLFDRLGRFGTTRGWFNCSNWNGIY